MVEPELVAITAIILAPIAYLIGNHKIIVNTGVKIIPPPMPKIAPNIPANAPIINNNNVCATSNLIHPS